MTTLAAPYKFPAFFFPPNVTMMLLFSLSDSPSSTCLILLRPASGDRATGGASLEWPLPFELTWSFILWDIPPVPRRGRWRVESSWRRKRQEVRGQKGHTEPEQCWKDCQGPHFPLLPRGNCGRFVSREHLLLHPSSRSPCRLHLELGTNTDCVH